MRFSYRTLFCGVIFRDFESDQDKRNKTARLVNMMDSNGILWENIKPTKKDAFDTMVTLRGRDEWLYATDLMIQYCQVVQLRINS